MEHTQLSMEHTQLSNHFQLIDFLRASPYTDQLLTGNGWLHISWNPFGKPRNYVRVGYYK